MKKLPLLFAIGLFTNFVQAQAPEENRFEKIVLVENLNEPLELAILPDERVLFIERHGLVKMYDPGTQQTKVIANIPVSTKYTGDGGQQEAEDGLLGLGIDPGFLQNHWVYLYYSPVGTEPKNILARYTLQGNVLDLSSKKVLLEIPTQREECCHTGGSIAWDAAGNLFLSTGDNTSPRASDGYAPIDERPGRAPFDAQKSSSNTNDLRGKILRIHPESDGTYTIPPGNLFPQGTPLTRPEIYTMGHRNPYRIAVDPKTGYLYWGDVGPDAGRDSTGMGPAAEDEFGQARRAGNFGWPYFVGDNKAYWDYDFASKKSGEKFNPALPINNSPNNTGLKELPAAQKAFIWYPAAESKQFPLLGSGGRSAMAGPVYYADAFAQAKRAFPRYYDKKLFIYEWMRDWIMAVSMNEQGDYVKMERFLPNLKLEHPIDMAFGPNGDLYVLEYGQGWFLANTESKLVRIEYNGGNRKPQVFASANKIAGALPLLVQFSAAGTVDFDKDSLQYQWKISPEKGGAALVFNSMNPSYTFTKAGIYQVELKVTDAQGLSNAKTFKIQAGNEPPQVSLKITKGNSSFFFPNKSINYEVKVNDLEDGSLENKKIAPDKVKIVANYQDAEDPAPLAGHQFAPSSFVAGKVLMDKSDCKACHFEDKKSIGPSFLDIAKKYRGNAQAIAQLSDKIIKGGNGVWGEVAMAPHPNIGIPEASQMVQYIMSLGGVGAPDLLPSKGELSFKIPTGANPNQGIYKLSATYTDKGGRGLPGQSVTKSLVLKSPTLLFGNADDASKAIMRFKMGETNLLIVTSGNTFASFKQIDLSGIKKISLVVAAPKEQLNAQGGIIEVHRGAVDGPLLGQSSFIEPNDNLDAFTGKNSPAPHEIPIPPGLTGITDLYFVFKNEQAKGALFVPFSLTFVPE